MYLRVSFLCLVLFAQVSKAQQSPSTILKTNEAKKIKLKSESNDHFMFNFTIDNVRNGSNSDSFYKSNVFNPNIGFYFLYDIPIEKTGLSIAPGIGFTFSKVGLDSSRLIQNASGTTFVRTKYDPLFATGSTFSYAGSSFYNSWLEVPFELRYRSKPLNGRSRIKVAVGMRAGINLAANSKVSYMDNTIGREVTMKLSPYDEIATFRYGATFRVGYGAINLFGYYGLNQFLKDNRNYNHLDIKQYSIGISLTGM